MNRPTLKLHQLGTRQERLEALIDEFGMTDIIDELATIAMEKMEHIQTNWPDDTHLVSVWAQEARFAMEYNQKRKRAGLIS